MEKYVLGICILFSTCIYSHTIRYTTIEREVERFKILLRYDSWTQELCTLDQTYFSDRLIDKKYIPKLCEQ